MTAMPRKTPKTGTEVAAPAQHDPFRMHSLEQILTLFDGGDFLAELMTKHRDLMQDLLDHNGEFGPKGCQGQMTLTIKYAVGNQGDVGMGAQVDFKSPKRPPSSAAAFINDEGELTLYSPMMARMQAPIRDASTTNYDPETGEIRDPD